MASKRNIKGITIEINGDVTKLDKALASVDKSLKTTQTSLKDVERLLKLDPKNVELLDQKQRLLAQRVEQTENRYELLKKTVEESTASNVRYDKWEQAQASLQGQITKTENALRGLEKEQEKLQSLGFSPDSSEMRELQEQIDGTREKAAGLQKQMAETYEELGRPISIDQYDALQRELSEATQEMEAAKRAAQEFSPELATAAVNSQDFADKMEGLSSKAGKVSNAFAPVSKAIAGIGAAALATVPATDDFRAGMSMLEANANNAGVSMATVEEAFRRFNAVTGDTDASIEAISNLLNAGFDDNSLLQAVDELSGAVISFPDTLKIESLADSLQETLATGEATGQFGELLERLGVNLEDFKKNLEAARTAEEEQLMAMQDLSHNGLDELYRNWVENNQGLIENRDATREFKEATAELAETILPLMTTLTGFVSDLVSWFAELPPEVQITVGVIAGLIALISPVAGIIAAIATAMGGFATASAAAAAGGAAVSLTLGQWLIIIAAVVAAVAGLIALLNVLFGKREEMDNFDIDLDPSSRGRSRSPSYPGFASGGVFEPNTPMLGVLGDNPHEREVAAPESMLRSLMREELAGMGGRSITKVDVRFTGSLSQLARFLQPVITAETERQGPSLA